MASIVNKNEVYTGQVIDFTHEGHGVVKFDRYPIFVPNAIKDEEIDKYLNNLQDILNYTELLNSTNLDELDETIGANDSSNLFRKD